jgi:hypothetical protein
MTKEELMADIAEMETDVADQSLPADAREKIKIHLQKAKTLLAQMEEKEKKEQKKKEKAAATPKRDHRAKAILFGEKNIDEASFDEMAAALYERRKNFKEAPVKIKTKNLFTITEQPAKK